MSKYLSKIRTSKIYLATKGRATLFLAKIPLIGKLLYKLISRFKELLKLLIVMPNIFEELGFYYTGPYDGHDIRALCKAFNRAKNLNKPIVIHTITKKGKGYKFAEENPDIFHGVKPFDSKTGFLGKTADSHCFSDVFGGELVKIAEENKSVMAITAAMPDGTGLGGFMKKFPERYFDVAIAEGHGVGLAAGLALGGAVPVFAVYSSFLQRGYDQLLTDVGGMNLHAVFAVDRAGIVGGDGETHQGVFDISYLTSIPNMTVMSPASYNDLRFMLNSAVYDYNSPVAIRYSRGGEEAVAVEYESKLSENERNRCGARVLIPGNDISLLCEGRMVAEGLKAALLLKEKGISAEVINLRYIKPIDFATVSASLNKTGKAVVMENNTIYGGVYSQICGNIDENVKNIKNIKIIPAAVPDIFVKHGSPEELFKTLGMDGQSVADKITREFF
jgi:1-deoxy-D-xylulose-5-phosphate synthase